MTIEPLFFFYWCIFLPLITASPCCQTPFSHKFLLSLYLSNQISYPLTISCWKLSFNYLCDSVVRKSECHMLILLFKLFKLPDYLLTCLLNTWFDRRKVSVHFTQTSAPAAPSMHYISSYSGFILYCFEHFKGSDSRYLAALVMTLTRGHDERNFGCL